MLRKKDYLHVYPRLLLPVMLRKNRNFDSKVQAQIVPIFPNVSYIDVFKGMFYLAGKFCNSARQSDLSSDTAPNFIKLYRAVVEACTNDEN